MEKFIQKPKARIMLYLLSTEGKKKGITKIRRETGVSEGYNDKIIHELARQKIVELKKRINAKQTYNITLTKKGKSIAKLLLEIKLIVEKGNNKHS
jgi:predicted transcriptional regulator